MPLKIAAEPSIPKEMKVQVLSMCDFLQHLVGGLLQGALYVCLPWPGRRRASHAAYSRGAGLLAVAGACSRNQVQVESGGPACRAQLSPSLPGRLAKSEQMSA